MSLIIRAIKDKAAPHAGNNAHQRAAERAALRRGAASKTPDLLPQCFGWHFLHRTFLEGSELERAVCHPDQRLTCRFSAAMTRRISRSSPPAG